MVRKKEEYNTSQLLKEAKKELKKLENMQRKIEKFQENEPEGCLKYQKKGKKTYFYHQIWNEKSKSWERKYIKKCSTLPEELVKKQYYSGAIVPIKKNMSVLRNLIQEYNPEEIQDIYENLSDVRKELVEPLTISEAERIRQWNLEQYEGNSFHPENLRYETDQGEYVRSKSEVIIANMLYQHRRDILYKYERPLELLVDRKIKTVYPDFTIMNIHTGKVWYWEHAGKMDDELYANDFVWKNNLYMANGFMPGKDVIYTYETLENPLGILGIRRIVEEILVGE